MGTGAATTPHRPGWAGTDERQQLRWVAAAAVVAVVSAPLVLLGTDSAETPSALALLLLSAAIAVAVLRRRLWEVGLVAHAAVTGGLTGLVLVAGYAAAVRWLPGPVAPAVAGLAVAALAFPVHRAVRFLFDRFLLGTDGDPRSVAARVLDQARTGPEEVLARAASDLARTLRLPWVSFEGQDGAELATAGFRPWARC